MTTKKLEQLLEAAVETQRVDFKASCPWVAASFAKDILALSNVQDGGYIIIGVEERDDGSHERRGVSQVDSDSYALDQMRDDMSAYADPHVDFVLHRVKDRSELLYVVIEVQPFGEIPVICRKDTKDTNAGKVYYRNRNRRVESAPVSNSHDMRDIIERAAVQLMRRLHGLGLATLPTLEQQLDDELEGM
ncbi:MAG: ATP-binding protein [bacterium]